MFSNSLAISWQLFGDFGDYENITMKDRYVCRKKSTKNAFSKIQTKT